MKRIAYSYTINWKVQTLKSLMYTWKLYIFSSSHSIESIVWYLVVNLFYFSIPSNLQLFQDVLNPVKIPKAKNRWTLHLFVNKYELSGADAITFHFISSKQTVRNLIISHRTKPHVLEYKDNIKNQTVILTP